MLVILGGLTGQLPPLDVSVNKLFKDFLRCEYEWLVAEGSEVMPKGCKNSLLGSYAQTGALSVVVRSFVKCGISLDDNVLWDFRCDDDTTPSDDNNISGVSSGATRQKNFVLDLQMRPLLNLWFCFFWPYNIKGRLTFQSTHNLV